MASGSGGRTKAVAEVCSLTLIVVILAWSMEAYMSWFRFWDVLIKVLMLLAALLAVVLPGRSPRAYGLAPRSARFTLRWSASTAAVFLVPAAVAIALSKALGVATATGASPLRLALLALYVLTLIGLVEEVFFRGYAQSRLNQAFGYRWGRLVFRAWSVRFGEGMLLASAIFAVVHVVNYWNPLAGRWTPAWWMPPHVLGAFAFGCLAGALREASGDSYLPAALHGSVVLAYFLLSELTNVLVLNVTLFVSWFLFFSRLHRLFEEAGSQEPR